MSYLIQTLLNLAVFVVATFVVDLALLYVLIKTELITVFMSADTLMKFKEDGKFSADYKNSYVVKSVEGAGIYKQVDEYLKDMEDEPCIEDPEEECEPETSCEEAPEDGVITEEPAKEDVTEEVKTE